MFEKLEQIAARLAQVEELLSDGDLYQDPPRAAKLLKEQKELQPVVDAYRQWKQLGEELEQAKELEAKGYQEIVITGIEIASWGVDLPGKPGVQTLIAGVCQAVPMLRVRLGSLEPRVITEEFCRGMQNYPNLCPQFHLSMQSGSDSVLKRMKRKYDTARYLESVNLLRRYFPGCAITTDMIVAFPGETEEEFAESLAFIQKCAFADMHIFPYSRRPGTPAASLPGQHDNATKERRSREAMAVAEQMRSAYCQALVGTCQ